MSQSIIDSIFLNIAANDAQEAASQVEMVLAERELVVRAMLDPAKRWMVTDMFVRDLADFRRESLPILRRALLVVNDIAARVGDYSVCVDGRDMLVLTGRQRVEGLTYERYAGAFVRWLEQVELLRDTVSAIGMEHFSLTYTVPENGLAPEPLI